jgi:uncharacterized membrane protein YiaA
MANKTQLGIGAAIAVIVAAYFGIDLNQQKNQQLNKLKLNQDQKQSCNTQHLIQIKITKKQAVKQ